MFRSSFCFYSAFTSSKKHRINTSTSKYFSLSIYSVLQLLTDYVVLSVRNRTKIVRNRTLFRTP